VIVSRAAVVERLASTLTDSAALAAALPDPVLPDDLGSWLGRLISLSGVPYPYLVPDEQMLPPESIRFFRLDPNWLEALVDGAFSIGRNLSTSGETLRMSVDRAVRPALQQQALDRAGQARARALGAAPSTAGLPVVSGFLLRSWLVGAYPGMGVNAYPDVQVPGTTPSETLPILRFERLGRNADTMICLVAGDATQFDLHEAPEHLHYGVDAYQYDDATHAVRASKNTATFTGTDPVSIEHPPQLVDLSATFRPDSPRSVRAGALAAAVTAANSAQLGYVMTEGVGLVSFTRAAAG
jgi:hypothetical protein